MSALRVSAGVVLLGGSAALAQPPANEAPKAEAKTSPAAKISWADLAGVAKGSAPKAGSLEDLIDKAVKASPDIVVAEQKAALAQAEMAQVRAQVAAKVMIAKAEFEGALITLESARKMLSQAQKLMRAGTLGQQEFLTIETTQSTALVAYEQKSAALKALTEPARPAGNVNYIKRWTLDAQPYTAQNLAGLASYPLNVRVWDTAAEFAPLVAGRVNVATAADPKADRIRSALASSVEIPELGEALMLGDFALTLSQKADPKVMIRMAVSDELAKKKIFVAAAKLSVSAWLAYLADSAPNLQVYVRDYGILVTDHPISDAASLRDFLRQTPPAPQAKIDKAVEAAPAPKAK